MEKRSIVNYTRPGRLHLIVRRDFLYFTLWLFGRRFHKVFSLGAHHVR